MSRTRADRGMVTAELALGLISLGFVTVAGLWLVWVLGQQVRCVDTVGEVARQLARGDGPAAERALAGRPVGAHVTTRREDGVAVVEIRLIARTFRGLPGVPLHAEARVALEPGEA